MPEHKRIGIWVRVSTDMQGDSPEHHELRARYYAQSKDWDVVEVYTLEALSGKSIVNYQQTKRMFADIKNGHIQVLVFSKLARLARNTRELLEIADYFQAHNADLVSLGESIDTSTPSGRLFYTIIAATAQFEREETASRVAASVPIRAKLGKPTGGQASYGYKWENSKLVVDPTEAPVRKLLYELFITHQRKKSTAAALNAKGYRTRNGSTFSATTVQRLLRDSTAKGEHRANYTKSLGDKKKWEIKPMADWVITACPTVVSPELWNECNSILDAQEKKRAPIGRKAVHLLSGLVKCHCGKVMYVFHKTKIYVCRECKNRIAVTDIDEIYQQYLQDYLQSINIEKYLSQSNEQLQQKRLLLDSTLKERNRLAKHINLLVQLRSDGEINKEVFQEQYKPLEAQLTQLDVQVPELEAEVDIRNIQLLSSETILDEVQALSLQWQTMAFEQKRAIVETITNHVEIGKADEITITLAYNPTLSQEMVEKGTAPMSLRLL
jgi:site-specific DNA recombinase